jgi:hypothetical protein
MIDERGKMTSSKPVSGTNPQKLAEVPAQNNEKIIFF